MPSEETVGLLAYLSKTDGIGGALKREPEDFLVEEITPDGVILEIGKSQEFQDSEGEYTHFTLEKRNWDTMRAAKAVSRACNVSHTRIKYAGTKDRRSVSTQRMSAWKVPKETLANLKLKDITLRDFASSPEPVNLGTLKGNRFTVLVRNVCGDADDRVNNIAEELGGKTPNFFGTQRFGLRLNNHLVGKHVLRGEFEEAVRIILCGTGAEPEEATKARDALRENWGQEGFKHAFKSFPNYLGFEKSVLNHLMSVPTDYVGAMRELPKKLRWMFVHAYQGYVFNLALSEYIKRGDVPDELPMAGHSIALDEVSKGILEKEGMEPKNFRVPAMPEMTVEGLPRKTMALFENFEVIGFNEPERNLWVRFTLPPGSYATMLLRELMKVETPGE